VRDEAEALEGRVAVTANKIKELEALAAQDEELTTMVSTTVAACCHTPTKNSFWKLITALTCMISQRRSFIK
jgi:hypothetical protein